MMDQARKVLGQAIPATQYAINFLNQNIAKPFQQGMSEAPGQQPLAFNNNQDMFRSLGNAFSNATPEGAGGAMGAHALPALGAALPMMGLGMKDVSEAPMLSRALKLIRPFTGKNSFDTVPDVMRGNDIQALDTAKDILKNANLNQSAKIGASNTIQALVKDYAPDKVNQGNVAVKALDQLANQTEDIGKITQSIPKELDPLVNEVSKYKNAGDFVKAHTQADLMDLSNRSSHRFGRIFSESGDSGIQDVVDINKQYGKDLRYYPDANVPTITNPNQEVTVYRSAPTKVKGIDPGDYVSFSKDYADSHARGKLIEMKVPAKDVIWQGNDFNEWVYSPDKIRKQFPRGLTDIYNKLKK